jgi:hypothetical protein
MKKTFLKPRLFLPVLLWCAVIFAFSSFSTGSVSSFYWPDFIVKKLAHVFEYALLTTFSYRALWNSGIEKKKAFIASAAFSVFYGTTDELHQAFVPGREPHIRDVVFDTIGTSLAIYYLWKLLPKTPTRLKNWARAFQLV